MEAILSIFFLLVGTQTSAAGGCAGPFPPPVIHGYRYTENPLVVETKVSSDYPISFNWQVRRFYEDWAKYHVLYYYVPDNGDDWFQVYEHKTSENTTLVRLSGASLADAPRKIQLQISVRYPCNSIEYRVNAVTLKKFSEGAVHFPTVTRLPRPEYVVQPGQKLTVPFKTETNHSRLAHYGVKRRLRRDDDQLKVEHRLFGLIERYKEKTENVTYTKNISQGRDGIERFSVRMTFKPWTEEDSGVFMLLLNSVYVTNPSFKSDPDRYYISHIIRAFFDIRSSQVVPPSVIVYNELDWLYRGQPEQGSDGTYVIPLNRAAKWAQSVRCIAHASESPELITKVSGSDAGLPWQTFRAKSTIIHTNTVRSDAFAVESETTHSYECRARAAGREATVTFKTKWFTPVKLVDRDPGGRYISPTARLTVKCTGKGAVEEKSRFVRFYLLNESYSYYPSDKHYFQRHQVDEVTTNATRGITVEIVDVGDQGYITGFLRIRNAEVLNGKKVLQCVVGDRYSFDSYRYRLKKR